MTVGISIREFAKRDGCSEKLVRRAIEQQRLSPLPDGKLDPALVGSAWRRTNRHPEQPDQKPVPKVSSAEPKVDADRPAVSVIDPDAADAAAQDFIDKNFPLQSLKDAETLKENYLARLRQLEYDQKSGRVVLVEEVTTAVGKKFAAVRSKLLAIPAEQAARLHRLKTAAEVQDALQEVITRALEELAGGDTGGL
ncbi:MAG TPA: hypothetical protein VFG62_08700 [Rhodopila sp.]|jgi:hypothetical protein|nr:hypothetical protein [Rhodopila sp.]